MLGTNGGLIGGTRTASALGSGVGLWTPNEQAALRRNRSWPLSGDPFYSYTSLLLSMDGANNSTTFTDSSPYGLTVTANGNAKISTAQSKFGGASAAFDGTGDWLSGTQSSLIGTGDFTIEAWIYVSSLSNDGEVFCIGDPSNTSAFNIVFETKSTGAIRGSVQDGSGGAQLDISSSASVILTSTWQHVAFVVSGSSGVVYVDGTSKASGTVTGSRSQNQTAFRIGRLATSIPRDFNGYIDELRITKGAARYTANFTPPAQAHLAYGGYNDPYFPATSLLLHMDGANNSTTFTDSSLNALTVTANGNAQISTAQSKFGGASAVFDGTGDYLSIPSTAMIAGTEDFTIEWWQKLSSTTTTYSLARFSTINGLSGIKVGNGTIQLYVEVAGGINIVGSASLTTNWQHIAICRSSSVTKIFVDGQESSLTANTTPGYSFPSTVLDIGRGWTSYGYVDLNGYIDDLRITKGVARYTANFTSPSAPFPDL